MKLLERYLQSVRFFLPRNQQEDILRELRDILCTKFEEREEELGRSLTEDEAAEILRSFGHPFLVAGRYREKQSLIGPLFFPIYALSLKLGLGVAALVTLVLGIVNAFLHGDAIRQIAQCFLDYPGRALVVFAWTTLSFALLELANVHFRTTKDWDPQRLPELVPPEKFLSRTAAFTEAFFSVAGLAWLLLIPENPWLIMGPAAVFLDPAPIWWKIYPVFVVLAMMNIGLALVNGFRPYWTPRRSVFRLVQHAASIGIAAWLLRADYWVAAKPAAVLAQQQDAHLVNNIAQAVNTAISMALVVVIVVAVVEIVREILRWRGRAMGPGRPGSASRHLVT